MKKIYCTTLFALLLLICTNRTHAQTHQTQLNQIELMKQFVGYWRCDFAKDTTRYWEVKPFGTGFECSLKVIIGGKVVSEAKRL
jgi:hypothetical protein